MRLSTTLLVLSSLLTLPACMAATGSDTSAESLGFDSPLEPGFGLDFDPRVDGLASDPRNDIGFESPLDADEDPRFAADCGCVFPGDEHGVTATCGEAVCFEEQSYFCTYEGVAVSIGACVGADDGALDLRGYEFPEEEAPPSSCQGDAGACEGTTAEDCEETIGCSFLPNGQCIGAPVACSSRTPAACTTLGGECFQVLPL